MDLKPMRLTQSQNLEGIPVNKELSMNRSAVGSLAVRRAPGMTFLRNAGIVLAGSALVAVSSRIALPLYFTPVPLTLQPFAVLLIGLLLTPRLAAVTLAAYLAEGALGLPVFAPTVLGISGVAHLLGPTGGYLMAYPAAAGLISLLWRSTNRGFAAAAVSAAVGDAVILGVGALWLAFSTHAPVVSILMLAVVPFLPGEALKIAAAAGIASSFRRLRKRAA
jgi:biotin transport system substrate-specific component